jgi:RND family efflux transporter MFP subunit
MPVKVHRIALQPEYEVRRHFTGTLRGRRTSSVGFERSGHVSNVRVDDGDRVQSGQVIARLDTDRLRARRRELHARLDEAQAGAELASVTSGRLDELAEREFATAQKRDEARFELKAANARKKRLRRAIDRIGVDLRKSRLRAPYAGTVTVRHVDEGAVVGAGQPVVTIKEQDHLEAVIGVPPRVAASLDPGGVHSLRVGGRSLEATIVAPIDELDPRTRTRPILFRLRETSGVVPGELARFEHTRTESGRGAWIPLDALSEGVRGLWSVLKLVPADDEAGTGLRATRANVVVVHSETNRAFVRGTLEDGDRIVATGVHRIVPGARVRPVGNRP